MDAGEQTRLLQKAVRTHDEQRLDALVSDRFIFSCARSIVRLGSSGFADMSGKADWIAGALAINWRSFTISAIRSIELEGAVVVDCRMTQVIDHDGTDVSSSWVVTDVWSLEDGIWRLFARHPELVGRK